MAGTHMGWMMAGVALLWVLLLVALLLGIGALWIYLRASGKAPP